MTNERKLATGSVLIAVAALRFLYKVSLKKNWIFEDVIPAPKKPERLPVILSPEEVLHFLGCVGSPKHRAILTSCYAAGLRISECIHLKALDIDSQRMVIRIDQGKGQKDRYVMLSPKLLETLRSYWRAVRPKAWLFEGDIPGQPINRSSVEHACQKARQTFAHAQAYNAPFAPARICRSSAGSRNRCPYYSTTARPPQPGDYRSLSPDRHQQSVFCGRAHLIFFHVPSRLSLSPRHLSTSRRLIYGSAEVGSSGRIPPLWRNLSRKPWRVDVASTTARHERHRGVPHSHTRRSSRALRSMWA